MKIILTFTDDDIHIGRLTAWLVAALSTCPYLVEVSTDTEEMVEPLINCVH